VPSALQSGALCFALRMKGHLSSADTWWGTWFYQVPHVPGSTLFLTNQIWRTSLLFLWSLGLQSVFVLLVHQCHSSIISSGFRDYSCLRLGLGVGKWSRLNVCIKMLLQGQQYMLIWPRNASNSVKSGRATHALHKHCLCAFLWGYCIYSQQR